MPPPPERYRDDLLQRTVYNIEQAKGLRRIPVPVDQMLGQPSQRPHDDFDNDMADMVSLPSSNSGMDAPVTPPNPTRLLEPNTRSDRIPDSQSPTSSLPRRPSAPLAPTRAQLTSSLNASTALVQNLRLRNSIQAADLQRANSSIEVRRASVVAKLHTEGKKKVRWMTTSCASLGLWVVYVGWCWVNSVEFEYVRRRRMDVLGML